MEIGWNTVIPGLKESMESIRAGDSGWQSDEGEVAVLFFSFDVVNSTQYKTQNKGKWAAAVSEILTHIVSSFANSPAGGYIFWKTLGDEITYTKEMGTMAQLVKTLDEIYEKLTNLNRQISEGIICREIDGQTLAIKATAWIADISPSCQKTDNISIAYQINDNRKQTDYLGPDIDAGFRVAAHSQEGRLMISYEVACLLHWYRVGWENPVKLVALRVLKGVWDGHPYPIFLYHGDSRQSFEASLKNPTKSNKNQDFLAGLAQLDQVDWVNNPTYHSREEAVIQRCSEIPNLAGKVDRLMGMMQDRQEKKILRQMKPFRRVHNTIACYQRTPQGLVFLLTQYSESGLWNLGSRFMYQYQEYKKDLAEYYQTTFGMETRMVTDPKQESSVPYVVDNYEVLEDGKVIRGSIFIAEMVAPPAFLHSEVYSRFVLLGEKDIDAFDGPYQAGTQALLRRCIGLLNP